ncbi:hypothetical protein Tco_1495074, partial [Tanacetum coccineum]
SLPPVQLSPTSPTEPASVGQSHKQCRSLQPTLAVPLPDTIAEAIIPEFVIPKAMALVPPVRHCRLIEDRRWAFARDDIDTWRHQEAEDTEFRLEQCERGGIHDIGYLRSILALDSRLLSLYLSLL